MKCTCLGTRCFNANPFLKHAHFPFPFELLTNIINSIKLELHQTYLQSYRHCYSLAFRDSRNETEVETLHAKVTKDGSLQNLQVSNHLLSCYAKRPQNLHNAHKLFDEIFDRDVRSWTILISGFARNGFYTCVLNFFRRMQIEGVCPNKFTLSNVLKCCSSLYKLKLGKGIHGWLLVNGIGLDVVLENSLLYLYVKCSACDYAKRLFESMLDKDTVSWNIMIAGYLHIGDVKGSLKLFQSLNFKDAASWNTIIDGLMRDGFERIALELLYKMAENGPEFNAITFSIALNLVSHLMVLEVGKQIHGRILRLDIYYDGFIRNSLLGMYCKCGEMKKASMIFWKNPTVISSNGSMAEIVSWSSMVAGYVQNGDYENALQTFSSMISENVEVDKFTLTSIVSACANIGILEQGRQIHAYIQKIGHRYDAHLYSSLIDMYAKCGSLNDAQMFFKETNDLNVVLWTSIIFGCALHGQEIEAVRLFECMINKGIKPNEITFVGVLTACSHAGLLEEGCKYFELMQKVFKVKPALEHYTCMVDLYGRAGHLNKIREFIYENGISHLSAVWISFLSSCRLHKNVELGTWVSQKLLQLEPCSAGSYILLSNMFATDHSWEESAKVRSLMQQRNVRKLPGQSWIQLKNQVH